MGIEAKDLILLVAGFALSIVASAVWQKWTIRSEKSRGTSQREMELWRRRLDAGFLPRIEAALEVIAVAVYWFVIGSTALAVSGVFNILDLAGIGLVRYLIVSLISVIAVACYAVALRWLRLYMRFKLSGSEIVKGFVGQDEKTKATSAEKAASVINKGPKGGQRCFRLCQ